jgi:TRAP-type mannitol/chloroaromatic compound transport system permease small subunit
MPRRSAREENVLGFLLAVSRAIDTLNRRVGHAVRWLILAAVLVSAGNAVSRYLFDLSSNAWLELQWYLFSAVFLLAAGYALLHNEHVRIDVIFGHLPPRLRAGIDLIGGVFFLMPMAIMIMVLSWPMVVDSYMHHEYSSDAGGLLRWPVKLLIPIGFLLLALQGVSEIVKRVAFLLGYIPDPLEKHHEPVAEEQLPKGSPGGSLS